MQSVGCVIVCVASSIISTTSLRIMRITAPQVGAGVLRYANGFGDTSRRIRALIAENPIPLFWDFDHTDRANKCYNVSAMICANKSLASVQDEAAKCVVRCANCHRRKTWKETRQFAEQCQPIPKASGGAAL